MNEKQIRFQIKDERVAVFGYPALEGREGTLVGDGIASFRGEGRRNYEWYLANTVTGTIRNFSTSDGRLLVDDSDIDYNAIASECEYGLEYAKTKRMNYATMGYWDFFKDGFCAISWMLYPDGVYFADSDGFGVEDNDEEVVYAIIDTELTIVEPFRPLEHINATLEEVRQRKRETITNSK